MSKQPENPTRVSLSLGSTTRLNEFDFSKISLSLERDLVPAENPIDAYRDIKALLERMVSEFQGPKPAAPAAAKTVAAYRGVTTAAKASETDSKNPSLQASKLETLRERLAKWLSDLEILDGFDGFAVKPKRFLGETWESVNGEIRAIGGKWQKGQTPRDGSWHIAK